MSGYTALRASAAWLDVSGRGKIRARGEDRQRFLHAMCTKPVEGLRPGQGTYAFFLDPQGRIQADAHLLAGEDHVLIETEPEAAESLVQHLERFIIMDDVTLENVTASLAAVALEGPSADEIAGSLFGELPAEADAGGQAEGVLIVRNSLTGQPGLRLVTETGRGADLVKRLENAGAAAAAAGDFQVVRVENQWARFGEDFFDTNLPQETQRLEAVSFTKGCYIGQEIVERVRSRGQVNRLLVGVELEADRAPALGSAVMFDNEEVGHLTSPVYSPRLGRVVGFGILRRHAAHAGASITVKGVRGRVREERVAK
jgi:aminomethyltransferase